MYICYKSFAELVRFIICEHRIVGHHIAPKTSPSSPKVKSKPDRKVNSLGQPCYLRNKKRSDSCFFCAAVCKKKSSGKWYFNKHQHTEWIRKSWQNIGHMLVHMLHTNTLMVYSHYAHLHVLVFLWIHAGEHSIGGRTTNMFLGGVKRPLKRGFWVSHHPSKEWFLGHICLWLNIVNLQIGRISKFALQNLAIDTILLWFQIWKIGFLRVLLYHHLAFQMFCPVFRPLLP